MTSSPWSSLAVLFVLAGCSAPVMQSEPPKFPCSNEEGYWQGRAGLTYNGWCTTQTAAAFLEGHQRGREIYELYRRRAVLEQEMNRLPSGAQREAARLQAGQVSDLIQRLEKR